VPPGVIGGVNAGDSSESGMAGVCSPATLLAWLALSDSPSGLLDSDCGGSLGEAWAGKSVIATVTERRGSREVWRDARVLEYRDGN